MCIGRSCTGAHVCAWQARRGESTHLNWASASELLSPGGHCRARPKQRMLLAGQSPHSHTPRRPAHTRGGKRSGAEGAGSRAAGARVWGLTCCCQAVPHGDCVLWHACMMLFHGLGCNAQRTTAIAQSRIRTLTVQCMSEPHAQDGHHSRQALLSGGRPPPAQASLPAMRPFTCARGRRR